MNIVAKGTFVFAPKSVGVSDITAQREAEENEEVEIDDIAAEE